MNLHSLAKKNAVDPSLTAFTEGSQQARTLYLHCIVFSITYIELHLFSPLLTLVAVVTLAALTQHHLRLAHGVRAGSGARAA